MKKMKRAVALLLTMVMCIGLLAGCGGNGGSGKTITLNVYSQLANYSGEMVGWFAQILKEKWNVKVNLIAESGGVLETRMEAGDLGDIVVFGSDDTSYLQAVDAGLLLDWEEDNMLAEYAPNIAANMKNALEKNREISGTGKVYGFGHNVAASSESHEAFFYTWDIRWDLYAQLGYPEVNNLDDMVSLFEKMKELCPTDDAGNATYAMSLWPDWDGNMVMYVKAMATAYYGYDEMGVGHYDVETGAYYDCLAEDSPYLEMLKFFNTLYRKGLLDPDSMTQTYDKMIEKVQNGGVFFSIFNYAGSDGYNKEEHYSENKIMRSLVPTEASPIAYGMSVYGGNRVWTIGANTQYPEICLEILDWLCTPEGRLTTEYGPKGVCWDYDENNKTYLTEFGLQCVEDRTTLMPDEWGGATFNDGAFQINNTTWSLNDKNPESGEKYDRKFWASTQSKDGLCAYDLDWREKTGCTTVEEYMEKTDYVVDIATTYAARKMDADTKNVLEQIANCITEYSWNAVYAQTDEEYNDLVAEMRQKAQGYGYDSIVEWYQEEAAIKSALQEPLRNN